MLPRSEILRQDQSAIIAIVTEKSGAGPRRIETKNILSQNGDGDNGDDPRGVGVEDPEPWNTMGS